MKKLSTVLIVLGVLIMLYPVAGGLYTQYQDNRMMEEWLQNSALDPYSHASAAQIDPESAFVGLEESFKAEQESNNERETQQAHNEEPQNDYPLSSHPAEMKDESAEPTGASPSSPLPTPKATPKASSGPAVKQEVIGVIIIDKIKVKCPIVEGVKKENLRVGVGHVPGTAALGQPGNCALAGHRSYTFGRFFNRLDELEEEDEIIIKIKEKDYTYTVYEKLIVAPDDVSVIKGGSDDFILTLITCTPIYIATHRLIVNARLKNPPVSETPLPASETPLPLPETPLPIPEATEQAPQASEQAVPDISAPDPINEH